MRYWVFAAALVGCASGTVPGLTGLGDSQPQPEDEDDEDDDGGTGGMTTLTSGVSLSLTGMQEGSSSGEDPTGGMTTGTTGDTPTSDSSSSSSGGPMCGNGVLEDGEECDGKDLGDTTCPDVDPDFNGGALACDEGCNFDAAGCVTLENPYEVCEQVDIAIPDSGGGAITSMITIPDGDNVGVVDTMTVTVELDHTYLGDLTIDVDHGGAAERLFDQSCGTQENMNVIYDDAGGAFDCPNSDVGNSYTPADPLAGFAGEEMGNTWTLTVEDNISADTGTLNRWCVTITWE